MTTTAITDLAPLRDRLHGAMATPGEAGYELSVPWNVAKPVHPLAVVIAEDAHDIAEAVRFAAANGMRVSVQRTGHGVTGMGPEDVDVLLVHTGRLDQVSIDAGTGIARVGAGAIWQQVVEAGAPLGLAPLVGSAPGVGVAGFLTGGGIGPMVRTYGLSSDRVRAFDLVTGDGEIRRATPDENADLFWGLRGGKSTLGIVTAVELELLPLTGFYGGALYFDGSDAAEVLHTWRTWSADLPEHANTSVALLQLPPLPMVPPPLAGKLTVAVRFTSTADPAAAEQLIAPLRAVATPLIDAIAPMPYAAIGAVHADPVDPMPSHEDSALLTELPAEAVDTLLALAGPGSSSPQVIVEIRRLGGALAREPRHASAFSHRAAEYSLLAIGVLAPPIADAVVPHATALIGAMAGWATGGVMPNFASSLDPAEYARCYDENTWHWLGALAAQYDPAGVFRIGQVVSRPQ